MLSMLTEENLYEEQDWDSSLFGYKVARITGKTLDRNALGELLEKIKKNNIKLVYWSVDPNDRITNPAAKDEKGFLADEKITYVTNLPKDLNTSISSNITSYLHKSLNQQVLSLSLQSGIYSRFKVDKHFINNEFEKLFTIWIERSLNGEIANDVLIYKENDTECGLITYGIKQERIDIGLLAVDEKFRGKAIGKKLIEAVFAKALSEGYNQIQVVTQKKNHIACKFYEKLGFRQESLVNVYHFWLDNNL